MQIRDVRLDLRLKLAYDRREFDPAIYEERDAWRMRRGGINGEIGSHLEFQIERDLNDTCRWRGVSRPAFRQLSVAAGRSKLPCGRGLTNDVGLFDDDGSNGALQEEDQFSVTGDIQDIGPSFAGRLTATPPRPLAETFETLREGGEEPDRLWNHRILRTRLC